MTILRPVTGLVPLNTSIQEESGLPFSFCITPHSLEDAHEPSTAPLISSATVPKCAECGGLFNPCSPILQFPSIHNAGKFLCALCGTVNRFHPLVQATLRGPEEDSEYRIRWSEITTAIESSQRLGRAPSRVFGGGKQKKSSSDLPDVLLEVFPETGENVMEYSCPVFGERDGVPVGDCPPVVVALIVDVMEEGRQVFYEAVCSALSQVVERSPKFAKLALLVGSSGGNLSVLDLSSHVPHLRHCKTEGDGDSPAVPLIDIFDLREVFGSVEKKHPLEAALRALSDSLVVSAACHGDKNGYESEKRPKIGALLDCVLDLFEDGGARHPAFDGDDGGARQSGDFAYAGGKVMVFLNGPPGEIPIMENSGATGSGGFGGKCAETGKRFHKSETGPNHDQLSESTQEEEFNYRNQYEKLLQGTTGEQFELIAQRAASFAMGIEIFAIACHGNPPPFGFPLLQLLSDRSGGCGPILIDMESNHQLDTLEKEVLARCPWPILSDSNSNISCVLAAKLRIRTTPSIRIEHQTPPDTNERFYRTGGMIGPCIADSKEDDLWLFGTCDVNTTCLFDLEIVSPSGEIGDVVLTDEKGEFDLPPCIQSIFQYTAIIPKETHNQDKLNHDIQWITVRRLRVVTTNLQEATDTEQLTLSIDAQALAFTLFHKLFQSSLSLSLQQTQLLGRDWLFYTLLATYRSAQIHLTKISDRQQFALDDRRDNRFYSSERILDRNGKFSSQGVLLAQGHDRLCTVPLLIYSMLQSDVLRPRFDQFRPSLDARTAAMANLGRMNPSAFSRSIAPRLLLLSSKGPIPGAHLNTAQKDIHDAVKQEEEMQIVELMSLTEEQIESAPIGGNQVGVYLFFDCPWQIVVYKYPRMCQDSVPCDPALDGGNSGEEYDVTPTLQSAIRDAVEKYRVAPPIHICLRPSEGNSPSDGTAPAAMVPSVLERLEDCLVDDSEMLLEDGTLVNFEGWCTEIAEDLLEEIESPEQKDPK